MKSFKTFTILLIAIFAFNSAKAQLPPRISIQGTLKDANGAAVADGTYQVEFRLYDVELGGTSRWTETAQVESAGGIYNHLLGSVMPLDATVFDQTLFLGIKLGAFELQPRTELTYAPYTFASYTALFADKVVCSGAVGDIKYSMLNPTQFALENGDCWVPMNGGSMASSKLSTILGSSSVPDASGLFFRAQEYVEGNDPDRTPSSPVATIQNDAMKNHNHAFVWNGNTGTAGAHTHTWNYGTESDDSGSGSSNNEFTQIGGSTAGVMSTEGNHSHSVSISGTTSNQTAGATETRPKNINLYVYIRTN